LDSVVFHSINERIGMGRKDTFCPNDDSNGIANPLVPPLRELECVERLDWEAEAIDPMPISRINFEVVAKCHGQRK
jgi:hypothetical protein